MIKICAIDLDGTLFDSNKRISESNKNSIKMARELGCRIIIATGRPYNGVIPVLKELSLTTENDYVICYNGAKIINIGTNEVIYSTYIDGLDLKKLYLESIRLNLNIHAFRDNEELITPKSNKYTDVETKINCINEKIYDFNLINFKDKFIKMMLVDDEVNLDLALHKIDKYFSEKFNMVRSAKIFLEFLNKKSDKGLALKFLADYLKIDDNDTMAIGDAGNDLSMIKYANIGVAMSNGFKEVKEISQFITLSNEESGVAYALNKYLNSH